MTQAFFRSILASVALITGIFEMTAGCQSISSVSISPVLQNACISFLLSFGGLCVLCQNAAFLMDSGIKTGSYFLFRIVHGALSFGITYIFS